jgi:hypothetical protein
MNLFGTLVACGIFFTAGLLLGVKSTTPEQTWVNAAPGKVCYRPNTDWCVIRSDGFMPYTITKKNVLNRNCLALDRCKESILTEIHEAQEMGDVK